MERLSQRLRADGTDGVAGEVKACHRLVGGEGSGEGDGGGVGEAVSGEGGAC